MNDAPENTPEGQRDLFRLFDLDRSQLVSTLTSNIEVALRDIDNARTDLKEILAGCKHAGFTPREIGAMKRVARLRKDDKLPEAQEELAALERVGDAVGFPLFEWARKSDAP